ncbi:MAG: AAA family ATPase, partial [Caldilineaceae bacterium]|nr:AAA family ATPase [Caldilineaceae bacterium]
MLYARQHDRRAALRQFEHCAVVLERDLGTSPLPETRAAYEAVRRCKPGAVLPPTPQWTTLPSLSLPLIGREQEWDLLATACRQRRHGGVILIDGEAGVGKSRLMQEVATAQGVLTLNGANHAGGQSLPYQPLSQALRQALALHERWRRIAPIWLAELTRLLPEITTQFAGLPQLLATAPQQAQTRLLEALTQAFFGLAGDSPLLLCLDDVHWADEATLGWLAYVSNRLSDSGLCIMATYRAVDAERLADWQANLNRAGAVTRVPVTALPEAAVNELLQRAGGQSDGQALAARIHAATGGNAFFVLETIRELLEMGNRPDILADLPLPQTVRDAVLRRVGRLTPLAQQLLAVAAVLSPHLHYSTLMESAGRSELETVDGIEELLAHQLLRTDGDGFRFQHELARHAVYEEISPWRRRLLHRRAGESLAHVSTVDQVGLLAAIAHHFAAAGDVQQAIVYLQQAAARAQDLLVHQEATAYLDKAIALAQAHEAAEGALPALYTALGGTLISAGDFARAETAYRNALSQVGRDDLLEWASLQH